ncbi:hypothetical protein GCM10027517_23870 [Phycicoccus ginsengisoli]
MSTPSKPVIVQHSFGDTGSGGPIGALERLLRSPLSDRYEFVRMHQPGPAGGINLPLVQAWASMLREVRPDLVHVRGLGNEGFHGVLAARVARCPRILVSIHGTVRDLSHSTNRLRQGVLVRGIEPATLSMATDVAAVCRAMRDRTFLDRVRENVRGYVPNGVNVPLPVTAADRAKKRAGIGLSPSDVGVVVVGRLSLEKGHLQLADALGRLDQKALTSAVLVLVGDGPDAATITAAYTAVPGLRLVALGRRHDVQDILQACDVFAFPTLHENLSNALLEAMAAGLPVVASAVGGNVEVLEQGGGILVPVSDRVQLSDAVERLVREPGLRTSLGQQGVDVIRNSYTEDHMVRGWDRMYQAILTDTDRQ